jgi:hypothetical protein
VTEPTEPPVDEELEAEIVRVILVLDVEPIPDLGDAPDGEPQEEYVEAPA